MSNIIPKEQQSAYQRWELDALDEPGGVAAGVALPTAEAIEQIHQQAQQAGFQEGLEQGREQGYREGREEARLEAQRLDQLLAGVREALRQIDQDVAQNVLDLALDISRQMLRQALQVKPELVLPVVREALASMPQANQHPQLFLNPRDAALVRSMLESELAHGHWRVVEDGQIASGGCRLETAHSDLDATLENRWQRVVEALGQSRDWLDSK